jgi:hypothetical protein
VVETSLQWIPPHNLNTLRQPLTADTLLSRAYIQQPDLYELLLLTSLSPTIAVWPKLAFHWKQTRLPLVNNLPFQPFSLSLNLWISLFPFVLCCSTRHASSMPPRRAPPASPAVSSKRTVEPSPAPSTRSTRRRPALEESDDWERESVIRSVFRAIAPTSLRQ